MRTEMVRVNKTLATEWLSTMKVNRKITNTHVASLALAMTHGEWLQDAAPIKFNTHGELVDGQHRLWAVIESDTTQEFLVAHDVDDEAFMVMDTGRVRTFTDILSIRRPAVMNRMVVASLVRKAYRWDVRGSRREVVTQGGAGLRNPVLWEYFEGHEEELINASNQGLHVYTGIPRSMATSLFAMACLLTYRIDQEDADVFWSQVREGAGLEVGSPVLALRGHYSDMVASYSSDDLLSFMLTLKAWNLFRRGEQSTRLQIKRGGAYPEAFPEPI